ncbi:MAG: hypothetical protein Q7K54_06405 [Candidatus Parcubacteria bacterium]|nr:hypothetical protein [Candidatus Parcubacteria bacterium]
MKSELKNKEKGSLPAGRQGGFLQLIIIVVVALLIMNYFNLTISGILSYFGTSISEIVTWFKTSLQNVFK